LGCASHGSERNVAILGLVRRSLMSARGCFAWSSDLLSSARNCSTMISTAVRFWPSRSCHSRDWIRPSTNTSEPFFKYCWAISACLPQTTILCHSVFFWRAPSRPQQICANHRGRNHGRAGAPGSWSQQSREAFAANWTTGRSASDMVQPQQQGREATVWPHRRAVRGASFARPRSCARPRKGVPILTEGKAPVGRHPNTLAALARSRQKRLGQGRKDGSEE
jgi:hypothetical protein